ncbi:hypothetical protein NPIL_50971 [Nephila pilipes]|uniref:Uncharacterized protein n=1 Tax=Nephila pilipes TaxID=299642 RepID=A0A8X6NPH1_NEPPI|nr:hypothetical protein NPIL_50971 [Nephila pilipes]
MGRDKGIYRIIRIFDTNVIDIPWLIGSYAAYIHWIPIKFVFQGHFKRKTEHLMFTIALKLSLRLQCSGLGSGSWRSFRQDGFEK